MITHPRQFSWSSHHCNGMGRPDSPVTPHPLYLLPGTDDVTRRRAYRDLFATHIEPDTLNAIRQTTLQELVLEPGLFRRQIERMLKRQTEARPGGRPRTIDRPEY
jgi:putative transposase